ncbi:MAG: sensor histidine kinase [Phycisphaerales bacterium]
MSERTPIPSKPIAAGPRRIIAKVVPRATSGSGLLAGMRIRKKLFFLHTFFSLALTFVLLVALRPAIARIVDRADSRASIDLLSAIAPALASSADDQSSRIRAYLKSRPHVLTREGSASELGIPREVAVSASVSPFNAFELNAPPWEASAVAFITPEGSSEGRYIVLSATSPEARSSVVWLYLYTLFALLFVYALVALALEIFVLPQSVYDPIRRILDADKAVQDNQGGVTGAASELIPEIHIPRDEIGEIMRSRNDSIRALRNIQQALNLALSQLETAATDLKRKNHLLQSAQRNLADADRLANLGMMSAGIAHELNTPLAVLKGSVEQIAADPAKSVEPTRAALMLRVVERLERLSESLLDFARVRPPTNRTVLVAPIIDEAATLVRLDRSVRAAPIQNLVDASLVIDCDADRITQVFVNLLRNAADAINARRDRPVSPADRIVVDAERTRRDGSDWLSIRIRDTGPGIDPAILPALFEPFASTRLDSRGTGLGLAVAEGIIREHDGILLARNRSSDDAGPTDLSGAVFEIMLPIGRSAPSEPPSPREGAGGGLAALANSPR